MGEQVMEAIRVFGTAPESSNRRGEGGSAMFIAVLMLVMMGWLGLAAMDTATHDRQVAGWHNRTRSAFYAAEAGVAAGKLLVAQANSRSTTPALPATSIGTGAMYARFGAQPQYVGDPAVAQPIKWVRDGGPLAGGNLSNPRIVKSLWQINVVGRSYTPAGGTFANRMSTARVEVIEVKPLQIGY